MQSTSIYPWSTSNTKLFEQWISFQGVIDFWQKIVCAKPEFQEWHALDCIKGNCPNCGLKLLKISHWRRIQSMKHSWIENAFRKYLVEPQKQENPKQWFVWNMCSQCSKYLDFMGSKLQQFVLHNFVATWEDYDYRLCMAITQLSCFLCWLCQELFIHGAEWDSNSSLAQLSNYNFSTLDLEAWLQAQNIKLPIEQIVWSDGCAS
jgi:hypothetical protein